MPRGLRLRVFAGPNGSGKSTIINEVRSVRVDGRAIDLGVYINADDLARELEQGITLTRYGIELNQNDLLAFAERSGLLGADLDQSEVLRSFTWKDGRLRAKRGARRDRLAQLFAQYLYQALLSNRQKFSFETVFSHRGKLELMKKAAIAGYKVYLYFIATEDPAINVERVKEIRVKQGGHDVPEEKIISRYDRTLALLDEALGACYHAFLWDNSQPNQPALMFAEMKRYDGGRDWKIDHEKVPFWFMTHYLLKHQDDPELMKVYRTALAFRDRSSGVE